MFGLEATRTNHAVTNGGGVEDWVEVCPLHGALFMAMPLLPVVTAWSEVQAEDGVRYVPAPMPDVRIRRTTVERDGKTEEWHYLDALVPPGVTLILAVCQ